jgi:hypothetical protein
MKSFIEYITENRHKETEWSDNLVGDKSLGEHLKKHKASGIHTNIGKNPLFKKFHVDRPSQIGSVRVYKHRINDDGQHEIKSVNSLTPNHVLHMTYTKRGKALSAQHKVTDDEDIGGKIMKNTKTVDSWEGKF